MRINQLQPSEDSVAGDIARQLLTVFGPAIQAPDGSHFAHRFLALGGALAAARNTTVTSLDEAFANTVVQLLSETEVSYGLAARPELSTDARHTRLLAKIRAARRGSPQGILKSVRTYDPTATFHEVALSDISPRTADGLYPGTDRDIYHVTLVVAVAVFNDTDKVASIRAILEQMLPAFVDYTITTSLGFILDTSEVDINAL